MRRSSILLKSLVEKEEMDALMMNPIARRYWYSIRTDLIDPAISNTFFQSYYDESTQTFLDASLNASNNICVQLWYSFAATVLSVFIAKTSINGLLGRGRMFLFSPNQFQHFMGLSHDWSSRGKRMLDMGAGDGGVTQILGDYFQEVYATDASWIMEWRLAQKGFKVIHGKDWKRPVSNGPYTLITALNLIDRHYDPWEFLSDLWSLSQHGGHASLVLISLVLPINAYVEFNAQDRSAKPKHPLPYLGGETFEAQVSGLVRLIFQPMGFELVRWTKMPYLCEGDLHRPYYHLDDAVFLLRPVHNIQNGRIV